MAHKSNGYIYTDDAVPSLIRNGVITFYNRLERYQEQAATLVMHGGKKHERVFTESEVRAMLEDMRNDPLTDELQRSGVIEPIAAKHGIALDPAYRTSVWAAPRGLCT